MDDKTWATFQELGYIISKVSHRPNRPLGKPWLVTYADIGDCLDCGPNWSSLYFTSEAKARKACLQHLHGNKEAMMSRMTKAILEHTGKVQEWRKKQDFEITIRQDGAHGGGLDGFFGVAHGNTINCVSEVEPHEVVYSLWCKIKEVQE